MSFEVICCVGDSIANGYWDERGLGWFGRLQEKIALKFPKKYGFNNLAQSGDRTWNVYHRMAAELSTRSPDILLIAVGINDITRWGSHNGEADQSQASRAEAWQKVLGIATQQVQKILVIGLLPNVESRYPCTGWDDKSIMWQINADTKQYNADIKQWCVKSGVEFLDVYADWENRKYDELFADGGHPNGQGHELLCTQVLNKMSQLGWVD